MILGRRSVRRLAVSAITAVCLASCISGSTHPLLESLNAYRDAKKRGDYAAAGTFLADDARIWFDKKEGPGNRLTAKGGPYKNWDKEFKSKSTREEARVVGQTVTYISQEINDFYRLIERTPTKARVTYYFDESGKITGMLYASLSPRLQRPPDRFGEFESWAEGRYPGLLDSEEMEIPNHPKRWRQLLRQWRAETGLPSIDSSHRAPWPLLTTQGAVRA